MFTTQRLTGGWLFFFTSCVVVNHFIQGNVSPFDLIYAAFLVPLGASAVIESKAMKVLQVSVILLTGSIMVVLGEPNTALGFVIMAAAPLYSNTYGFLVRHTKIKIAALTLLYLGILFISFQNWLTSAMWIMMCITINGGVWINVRHMIERARKADELEKRQLEQDLKNSQNLLHKAVSAGVVLVEEIKHKEAEHGCEG